jgi:hypothetical protein
VLHAGLIVPQEYLLQAFVDLFPPTRLEVRTTLSKSPIPASDSTRLAAFYGFTAGKMTSAISPSRFASAALIFMSDVNATTNPSFGQT